MALIKFYKIGPSVWAMGQYTAIASNICTFSYGVDNKITINAPDGSVISDYYYNFCDSIGIQYASLQAFKAAINGFFSEDAGAELFPAGKGSVVQVRLTRPVEGSPVQYTAGDVINSSVATPVSVNVPGAAMANGRAFWIMAITATTNMLNLADGTIRVWLYRTEPTGIVGDNFPMTNSDENTTKGRWYIDIKFNSLLVNSTTLVGQKEPVMLFITDPASSDLKLRAQTLVTFTPVSAGWIDLSFSLLQL